MPILPYADAKGPRMSRTILLACRPLTRHILSNDNSRLTKPYARTVTHLEQDAGGGSDLNGGPAALKAPRGIVHEPRLLHVLQGAPRDPPQKRHQLAPVAHAQAEGVRPAAGMPQDVSSKLW